MWILFWRTEARIPYSYELLQLCIVEFCVGFVIFLVWGTITVIAASCTSS